MIKYELSEKLGEGNQGRVFKALRRDRASGLEQTVAAKILHSKTAVNLWKQEFDSLNRVHSPHCVRLLSFERIDGHPTLILEFVDGVSLYELLQGAPLSDAEAREIMAQAELGLLDLYRYGSFHGDLSPRNIMIDREGRLRLLDFGLANCGLERRMTAEFASPERLAGEKASFASDLFSLGRIEQYLNGRGAGIDSSSPYLQIEPSKRAIRGNPSKPLIRARLGEKVLERQNQIARLKQMEARTMVAKSKTRARLPQIAASFAAALLLMAPGASQSTDLFRIATLSFRTHHWHHFRLNGRPMGYAPLSLAVEANRLHELEWTSPTGKGRKSILLRKGEHLSLTDRDFSH
ncbi:MAG TPA: protein kinase [Bdellovibrionales bacterium]|nr:protein kinase [Bdellovibrionales bacterium]